MAVMTKRRADQKRAQKPERKEAKKKIDQNRSQKPERKEVVKKADQKREPLRSQKPERKEVKRKIMKKVDQKRSQDPKRKDYWRQYNQSKEGRSAKKVAQKNYKGKLGDQRVKAQYRRYQQAKIDREKGGDALMRRIKFQKAVLRGPEYGCSSCHRLLFRKSVTAVTQKLREKIRQASEERVKKLNEDRTKATFSELNSIKSKAEATFSELNSIKSKLKKRSKKTFEFALDAYKAWNAHLIKSVDDMVYLCSTCKGPLQKGNMPAMCVANGLQMNHPDRPVLTELESDLIAHNINFQKMVLLQKSCWAAGKGRLISIPVQPADIMNTVKQLPRLPNEAEGGMIPIKLKRKQEYKTAEKQEHIRPGMIFTALKYLNTAGHPYYKFYDDEETYKARCKIKDLRLLYGEEVEDDIEEDLEKLAGMESTEVADEAVKDSDEEDDDEGEDDMEEALEAEEEDIQNDPVRRQHFNYSEYSTLVNGAPEIFLDEDGNQTAKLDFAPGEGKKPKNPSDQKDWDIRSWPCLLPDGKFGLDWKRRVKLTRQNYFQQRILNVDDRFAKTKSFLFAAMSVIEAERLRSNANLSGIKGRRITGPDGAIRLLLDDPCSVFEKIKGTPKYWQRVRYEIIAKLENIGPFQVMN